MQREIDAANPRVPLRILGINAPGYEPGNVDMVRGRTLPWLQDVPAVDVNRQWGASNDELFVLDPEGHLAEVLDLLRFDPLDPSGYQSLRGHLLELARR